MGTLISTTPQLRKLIHREVKKIVQGHPAEAKKPGFEPRQSLNLSSTLSQHANQYCGLVQFKECINYLFPNKHLKHLQLTKHYVPFKYLCMHCFIQFPQMPPMFNGRVPWTSDVSFIALLVRTDSRNEPVSMAGPSTSTSGPWLWIFSAESKKETGMRIDQSLYINVFQVF